MGFGRIIFEKRNELGMTREQLSTGICTEKHLYFIETGQRNPSVQMLRNISVKLGCNLFDYIKYEDCSDPIQTKVFTEKIHQLLVKADFQSAWELAQEAAETEDFIQPPLRFLIDIVQALYTIFVKRKMDEAAHLIKDAMALSSPCQRNNSYYANLMALLAASSFYRKKYEESLLLAEKAEDILNKSTFTSDFDFAYLSIRRIKMSALFFNGKLDDAIKVGKDLLERSLNMPFVESKGYLYFALCFAYFIKEDIQTAEHWLEKVLSDLTLYKNENLASYIFSYEEFYDILKASKIPESRFASLEQNYSKIIDKHIRKE